MDLTELEAIAEASQDRFRLETLPAYAVEQEADEFAAWQRGERQLPGVADDPWLRHIRETTQAGAHWWRVRIVEYPLTPYVEYELHGLQANAMAGEDVYVADRAWADELGPLREDAWIFDDGDVVVRMDYDHAGHPVGAQRVDDVQRYLGMRAVAMRHAVSLGDFLAVWEPRLIA
ncbi:DUF6879 family protein [Actinophytocola sp.]|uniref:DUF6879 family protein n=1 Tax=Actinophytocola sp. TaxID=1872138 RepID=UPI002ED6269E